MSKRAGHSRYHRASEYRMIRYYQYGPVLQTVTAAANLCTRIRDEVHCLVCWISVRGCTSQTVIDRSHLLFVMSPYSPTQLHGPTPLALEKHNSFAAVTPFLASASINSDF
jgi:hypothetical protein